MVSTQAGPYTVGNDGAAYVAAPDPAGLQVAVDVLANDGDADSGLDPSTMRVVQPPARGRVELGPVGP